MRRLLLLSVLSVAMTCGLCDAGELFATRKSRIEETPQLTLPDVNLSQIATSARDLFKRPERKPKRYPPQDIDITGLAVIAESAKPAPQVTHLVKLGASWCVPCRNQEFVLKQHPELFSYDEVDAEDGKAVAALEREYGKLPRNADGSIAIPLCLFKTSKGDPMYLQGYHDLASLKAKLAKWDAATVDAKPDESEQAYGIKVGSVPAKAQIGAVLQALEPYFDGGTLTVTYTPRAGVVREWVTIKQGPAGVKLPRETSITFTLDKQANQLVGKFNGTAPRLIAGPFERSPQQIEVTPDKIAIRIPWAPDPEIAFTD